jgi:hypothetical protein
MLDFLFAMVTALAAAAFAQFGVTLDSKPGNAAPANPEVHRTIQGGDQARAVNAAARSVTLPAPPVPNVGRKGGG